MSDVLGTGWGFPVEFKNKGNDVQLVSDEVDVRQSLEILFSTAINERLQRPDFGCDLKRFLFEEVNQNLVTEIEERIIATISSFEPRIQSRKIMITDSENESHVLLIELEYTIVKSNTTDKITYPLKLY